LLTGKIFYFMGMEEETFLRQFDCINNEYLKVIWHQDISNTLLVKWTSGQKEEVTTAVRIYIRDNLSSVHSMTYYTAYYCSRHAAVGLNSY